MRNRKNRWTKTIEELTQGSLGISIRTISIMGMEVMVLYISQLTDKENLSNMIIRPILQRGKNEVLTIDQMISSVIYIDDASVDDDEMKITEYILNGNSIILMANEKKYIVANTLSIAKRKIQSPEIETTLRGSKDAFTENFEDNLSLIRYRIKDASLRIDKYTVGRRTKTQVGVLYIEDVANPQYVNKVKDKIQSIDIDGVIESGYIQKFIRNNTFDLFPQSGIVERSEAACADILEGKVLIMVEGSNLALVTPKTFIEFLDAGDDHYDNIYLGILSKFIRALSLLISLGASAFYVAVVGFQTDILPPQYILALANSRVAVPFNAILEATLMEFTAEILREASIRLPNQIGPAIGIVGAIVIGQAAVAAGLVSPLMVIIVSLSMMCSFIPPDITIMNPIRILKFGMISITGIFGLFGFIMGFTFIAINLCSLTTSGVSYVAPFSPFHLEDVKNYILGDITLSKKRPKFLNTQDKTRR
jgi:hypothetical protein